MAPLDFPLLLQRYTNHTHTHTHTMDELPVKVPNAVLLVEPVIPVA